MAVQKRVKLQPATHEKSCQICGSTYTYPEKGSNATRYICANCNALPNYAKQVLSGMGKRIQRLEKTVERLSKKA